MEELKENLIPCNYFLTKSMEFTRESVSGTLWYLKKYLVLYYNIFLNDGVSTEDGIQKIINIFEQFIESLPEESREDATNFFFPSEVDIRGNYNNFAQFKGNRMFSNISEENDYINTVKKYYFVYLMQIGGQSGVKRHIRDNLYKQNFCMENLDDIINEYLSEHPEISYSVSAIKSDYPASLRNERQILWYYGFVHSKSTGSADIEFSSLTPVGEIALVANYDEFRIIWEHQKLKMISQPVTVSFSGIENNLYANGEKFALNFSPYITILQCLYNDGVIQKETYQYIISRTNNKNRLDVVNNINVYKESLNEIKKQVILFDRASDIRPEDFDKELKKYMLGIRDDLRKDYNKNTFGLCSYQNGFILNNKESLEKILLVYRQIEKYKINKYTELFNQCEIELRKKYIAQNKAEVFSVNPKTKIDWDLYNIHIDKTIIIALIILDYIMYKNVAIDEIKLKDEDIRAIKNKYKELISVCNLSKMKELNSTVKMIYNALINNDLENMNIQNEVYVYAFVNEYSSLNVTDLKQKIELVSNENVNNVQERVRSTKLINLIRALYNSSYSDENKLIKCECCGKKTFLTAKDEAYLEYHHLLPFSIVDGPDHYINIYGICPDCHRRIHFGKDDLKEGIYNSFNQNNHLNKTIIERFEYLYNNKILKSYQLEYALVEHIINEAQYNQILAI